MSKPVKLKVYRVVYWPGLALPGEATVIAESAKRAEQLVREHGATPTIAKRFQAEECIGFLDRPNVLTNWNGDY